MNSSRKDTLAQRELGQHTPVCSDKITLKMFLNVLCTGNNVGIEINGFYC